MTHAATRTAGTLQLHVRYIGTHSEPADSTRRQYEYRIRTTEPGNSQEYVGADLYSGVGHDIDAEEMLRTLAATLDNAAERYAANMHQPDDEYPAWLYQEAYDNADELGLLAIENELRTQPDEATTVHYIHVVFHNPGDDAEETLNILDKQGPDAALEHLTKWDYGSETEYAAEANGHIYDEPPSGDLDHTYVSGDYTMTYNRRYGYIGLVRRIELPNPAQDHESQSHQGPNLTHRDRSKQRNSPWTRPAASEDATGPTHQAPPRGM